MTKYYNDILLIKISIFVIYLSYTCAQTAERNENKDKCCTLSRKCDPKAKDFRLESLKPLTNWFSVSKVQLTTCPLPQVSYKALFSDLNINFHESSGLHLKHMTEKVTSTHMDRLEVNELVLEDVATEHDVLEPLTNLKKLLVKNYILPHLPKGNIIEYVKVDNATVEADFGYCRSLKTLIITHSEIKKRPAGWLFKCNILSELEFHSSSPEEIIAALQGVKTLKKFRAEECMLSEVPQELLKNKMLTKLDLSHNTVTSIGTSLAAFPFLQELLLSNNPVEPEDLSKALVNAKALRLLVIKGSSSCNNDCRTKLHLAYTEVKTSVGVNAINFTCTAGSNSRDCFIVLQMHLLMVNHTSTSASTWLAATVRRPVSAVIRFDGLTAGTRVLCRVVNSDPKHTNDAIFAIGDGTR